MQQEKRWSPEKDVMLCLEAYHGKFDCSCDSIPPIMTDQCKWKMYGAQWSRLCPVKPINGPPIGDFNPSFQEVGNYLKTMLI